MCCSSSIGPLVCARPVISSPQNLVTADHPLGCLNCKSTHLNYWISDIVARKVDNLFGFCIERNKQSAEWRLRERTKWNALLDGKSCSGSPIEKLCILHFDLGSEPRHVQNRWGEDSLSIRLLGILIHTFNDGLKFCRVMMLLVTPKITGWLGNSNLDYSCIWIITESWAFLAQHMLLVQRWMFHKNKKVKPLPPWGTVPVRYGHSEVLGYFLDLFVGTFFIVNIH